MQPITVFLFTSVRTFEAGTHKPSGGEEYIKDLLELERWENGS